MNSFYFLKFFIIVIWWEERLVGSGHQYDLGRFRHVQYRPYIEFKNYNEHPRTYPTSKPKLALRQQKNLYQGVKRQGDYRVYNHMFNFAARIDEGQKVVYNEYVKCKISHIAVETTNGIPILLRGGVGYDNFLVVVTSKPGDELTGSMNAYCSKIIDEYQEKEIEGTRRKFGKDNI